MIKQHGIINAVERVVTRPAESTGYIALVKMGLQDKAFESVVLRHPDVFTREAIECCQARLRDRSDGED
jgi:hypothetical protein